MRAAPTSLIALLLASQALTQSVNVADTERAGLVAIENLGVAIAPPALYASSDIAVFRVDERDQGDTDLNGDGDAVDQVVHVADLRTGALRNLGVSSRYATTAQDLVLEGPLVVVPVSEAEQGGTDLNGDGDTNDYVVHVYDARTDVLTNLGLATSRSFESAIAIDGETVVFYVPEQSVFDGSGQGVDLNGDMDIAFEEIAHVYRADTMEVTNLGFAAGIFPVVAHGRVGLLVREASQGSVDLNGDGDISDQVLVVIDLDSGAAQSTGLASASRFVITPERTVFPALEEFQGAADLNGDGDANDWVLHSLEHGSSTPVNGGVALTPSTASIREGAGVLGLAVSELQQGQTDLNGDGDGVDSVLHTLDANGALTNRGLAVRLGGSASIQPRGNRALYVFQVDEERQGSSDLNGDGDTLDDVPHCLTRSGSIVNVGLSASSSGGPELASGLIGLVVYELDEGFQDLNGDGDSFDRVVHMHNACTGETFNYEAASGTDRDVAIGGGFSAFLVRESSQGDGSLNADGDISDSVLFIRGARMRSSINVGLACAGNLEVPRDGVVLVWVDERDEASTDLNGDGDTNDFVPHIVRVR
ncbi:MAG: hypothetical protein AAGA20_13715 [Planctomycetota bacterium]